MSYILNIFQRSFLNEEKKFLSLFSFFLMSFLCLHFIIYLNFFKFSDSWVNNESKIITIQIAPSKIEKVLPVNVKKDVINFFNEQKIFEYVKPFNESELKDYLGITDLNTLSSVRVPFFLNLKLKKKTSELNTKEFLQILGDRTFEIIYHRDEISQVEDFFVKVKLFIFLIGALIFLLFLVFLILIIKATILANFKFLEIIQVMGADSKQISINISIILMKKILFGTLFGSIFSVIISSTIIKLFSIPFFNNIDFSSFAFSGFLEPFFYLFFFIIITLMIIFFALTLVTFRFLEKKFFV